MLIIDKALYGLKSGGRQFNHQLQDVLATLGFNQSKAEDSIFIRKSPFKDCYEYIATYGDDLCIVVMDPEAFIEALANNKIHPYKLKGSGPLNFHLGCAFKRDDDGTLYQDASQYAECMKDNYKTLFPGKRPSNRKYRQPLDTNDHPELDTSAFCDKDDKEKYQSLIGSMQWAVSLGRFDIMTAVMTLSSFRECPRVGHLDQLHRMVSFLYQFRGAKLRYRTEKPDFPTTPDIPPLNWKYTPYGNPSEQLPLDAPEPLGESV